MHPFKKPSKLLFSILATGALLSACAQAEQPIPNATASTQTTGEFLIRDNDVWVQLGDSITAQALYTTYVEAFIRARYPKLKFVTVNSGKSGEVTGQGMIRFRGTVAAFKPTLVTTAFGMNDHTKIFPFKQHFGEEDALQIVPNKIKQAGARWVVVTSSPLLAPENYGTDGGKFRLTGDNAEGKTAPRSWRANPGLRLYAAQMQIVADRNHVPMLDIMTPLQIIWGANYERDWVAALRDGVRGVINPPTPAAATTAAGFMYHAVKPVLVNKELVAKLPIPDKENFVARWFQPRKTPEQFETYRLYLKEWLAKVDASTPSLRTLERFHRFRARQ